MYLAQAMTSIHHLGKLTAFSIVIACGGMHSCTRGHNDREYADMCRADLKSIVFVLNNIENLHLLGDEWSWQGVVGIEFTADEFFGKINVEHYQISDLRGRPYRILLRKNGSLAWADGLDGINDHGTGDDIVIRFDLPSIEVSETDVESDPAIPPHHKK